MKAIIPLMLFLLGLWALIIRIFIDSNWLFVAAFICIVISIWLFKRISK